MGNRFKSRHNFVCATALSIGFAMSFADAARAEDPIKSVAPVFLGEVKVGNFDPTAFHAYHSMIKNKKFEKSEFAEAVPFEKAVEVLADFARRGFGLVIAHSEGYQAAVHRVAEEFPDTHFVISPAGETGDLPNVSVYEENPFHVLLLPGMVAVLTADNGHLYAGGFVEKSMPWDSIYKKIQLAN